ncbi:hypothetical protein, partial [Streptomyces sp. NPDC059916]|uniref:hypothetical protein n=1 Tax=Streptomyces sp. NPDC059916 TaxID=3347001 RepID=UPI00368281FC
NTVPGRSRPAPDLKPSSSRDLNPQARNATALHLKGVAEGRARVLGPNHPWTLSVSEILKQYRSSQQSS